MGEPDAELAPMVDGLSSALCMLILVATVFIIGTIDTSTAVLSESFHFKTSILSTNTIFYDEAISLPKSDFDKIRKDINGQAGKVLVVTGYQNGEESNLPSKLAYNFAIFQKAIGNIPMEIQYVQSKENICHVKLSCIKWEVQ